MEVSSGSMGLAGWLTTCQLMEIKLHELENKLPDFQDI